MDALNKLIHLVTEANLNGVVYQGYHLINVTVLAFFCSWYGKKYKMTTKQSILTLLIMYPIGLLWLYIQAWVENGFTNFGAINIVRGFIYFPLFALIPAHLCNLKKEVVWDFMGPCEALHQGVAHIACVFAGCCYGYSSTWGVWNPVSKEILFPIQIVECVVSLVVCIICVLYARGKRYDTRGRVYPMFLILFGATRFFLEFLRDNEKIWAGISILAVHAALMVLVGVLMLLYIKSEEMKAAEERGSKRKARG